MYTDDAFLCSILPQYGDRLALINFAKQTNVSKRKSALFDKLMSKVKKNNDDICESSIDSPNQRFVYYVYNNLNLKKLNEFKEL